MEQLGGQGLSAVEEGGWGQVASFQCIRIYV